MTKELIQGDLLPNISKLYQGLRLANYKQLCILMGEQPQAGNAKKAQINNWKRYFNYITEGYSIIITDVYDKPLAKIDGRNTGNNTIWLDKISLLFLNHLVKTYTKEETTKVYLTKSDIVELVGLCNEHYKEAKREDNYEIKKTNIPIQEYRDFFYRSSNSFNSIVSRMLESLEKRYIITYEEVYKVKPVDELKLRNCTEDEKETIQLIYGQVLDALNLKSRQEVYINHKDKIFYKNVTSMLLEKGIEKHWTVMKIKFHGNVEERRDNYVKSVEEQTLTMFEVNELSCNSRKRDIVTQINKHTKDKESKQLTNSDNMINICMLAEKESMYKIKYNESSITNGIKMIDDYIKLNKGELNVTL